MYLTNFKHFLDDKTMDIPLQMPLEARERANFFALIIDATTQNSPPTLTETDVHCFEKGCNGKIKTALRLKNEEINWFCPDCENEGVISEWQKTKWDKR